MTKEQALKKLEEYERVSFALGHAAGILSYDGNTVAPKQSAKVRAVTQGELSRMGYELTTAPETEGEESSAQIQTPGIAIVSADTFAGGAAAAWGSPYEETPLWKWHYDLDLIRNLRDVVHDMGLEDFNDTGTYRD